MAIRDLCYVDAEGLHLPDYPTVLAELQGAYRGIYGADVYLEPDSQDGQWVAVVALAIFETMQVAAAVYNSFSPATAQGDALSRQVKINGLRRLVPTASQVDVTIVGVAGTTIVNGLVEDSNGQRWSLPAEVVIPPEGEVTVTATASELGSVAALAGTVTRIVTPTRGWQSVTNPGAASPGDPTETDAELRIRQSVSTMIPSLSVMEGIVGAVASLDGVTRWRGYENDTGDTDSDGIPGHTIAVVVEGGDSTAIAAAIHGKKTAGTGTWAPDFDHAPASYAGSSVTSLAIGTGTKVFTTQTGLPWTTGMRLRAAEATDHSKFMEGVVTSYSGSTLTLEVDLVGGAGTEDFWYINLAFPGGTTVSVEDEFGVETPISFIRPTPVAIDVEVTVGALTGYLESTGTQIAVAVADSLAALGIGETVYRNRLFTPANLGNVGLGATFAVQNIRVARDGEALGTADVALTYNEVATCDVEANVTVVVA